MLKGLRELAELALGLCFDLVELVQMLQIPVIASSTCGADKLKSLQLSAFLTIAVLIIWAATTHRPTIEGNEVGWLAIGGVSTVYLSASAGIIYYFLQKTRQYVPGSELKIDALSVVLTFNFVVILAATIIIECNHQVDNKKLFSLDALDGWTLYLVLLIAPAAVAAAVTLANSLRYLRDNPATSSSYARLFIFAFVLLNAALADIFVYVMYVSLLGL
jgi:hypothetical protein